MFQDANSNFFQNVRIQKHFDALFDALNTQLSRRATRIRSTSI